MNQEQAEMVLSRPRFTGAVFKLALGSVVSIILVYLIARQVPLSDVISVVQRAEPRYIVFRVLVLLAAQLILGVRWQVLSGSHLPMRDALAVLSTGALINAAVPLRLGDLARIWLMSQRSDVPVPHVLSALVVER